MNRTPMAHVLLAGMLAVSGTAGCRTTAAPAAPATQPGPAGHTSRAAGGAQGPAIEVSYDELLSKKQITQQTEMTHPGALAVSLGASPSTGFQWQQNATISDTTIVTQSTHESVAPDASGLVGSPGKDVWTFTSLKAGTAVIRLSYSRPWAGAEKDAWTYTLTVTVK